MSGEVRISPYRLTDPESRRKVAALIDPSILLWKNQARDAKGTMAEVIAENYVDAFEAIRLQLLGPTWN